MEIFVNDETRKMRGDICQECDKLTPMLTCSICNCFMPAKTRLPGSYCPEQKWLSVTENKE